MRVPKPPKPVRNLLVVLFVLAVLYMLLGGINGITGFYRLHTDVRRLESQLTRTHEAIDSLQRELERLKSDTAYIERTAREKLGMARRDERIYKFVEEK
jgi:cell division protein FtsL